MAEERGGEERRGDQVTRHMAERQIVIVPFSFSFSFSPSPFSPSSSSPSPPCSFLLVARRLQWPFDQTILYNIITFIVFDF